MRTVESLCVQGEEVTGQQDHVPVSFPKGGNLQRHDVQAIVEIFAKPAPSDLFRQVSIRRSHQAEVGMQDAIRADPGKGFLFEDPQELALDRKGQLPHLIEEQSAPVGQLDTAALLTVRTGEGPLLVPEQLAFQEGLRDGRGVDDHVRGVAAQALPVYTPGHEFLANARFAQEQDDSARLGDPVRLSEQLGHATALGEDRVLVEGLCLDRLLCCLPGLLFQQPAVRPDAVDEQTHVLEQPYQQRAVEEIEAVVQVGVVMVENAPQLAPHLDRQAEDRQDGLSRTARPGRLRADEQGPLFPKGLEHQCQARAEGFGGDFLFGQVDAGSQGRGLVRSAAVKPEQCSAFRPEKVVRGRHRSSENLVQVRTRDEILHHLEEPLEDRFRRLRAFCHVVALRGGE